MSVWVSEQSGIDLAEGGLLNTCSMSSFCRGRRRLISTVGQSKRKPAVRHGSLQKPDVDITLELEGQLRKKKKVI